MTDEVLSVHNWPTNAAMIADVARLGYLDGRVLDATYGEHGGFWKVWRPAELVTNDLRHPADHSWDFRNLPLTDCAFDAVVFDPDYKLNGTPAMGEMDERFGVDENLTRSERLAKIAAGAIECYRVCRVHLLVKCQDQVEGGVMRWQTDLVTHAVGASGGVKVDRFDLLTRGRPQPSNRTRKHGPCKGVGCDDCDEGREPSQQQTARHDIASQLLVFRKPKRQRSSSATLL